jgi:tetratricopeptide (TPR) repeat protein/tRNA A-37 threonylcarbamoyl transferase component Bud32
MADAGGTLSGTLSGDPEEEAPRPAPAGTLSGDAAAGAPAGTLSGDEPIDLGARSDAPTLSGEGPAPGSGAAAPARPGVTILSELGRGGMGVVYRAREDALDREVALKALLDPSGALRFAAEAKITARLEHPGIPPIYAFDRDEEGRPRLAMRLVRGVEWKALLEPRSEEERARAAGMDLRAHLDILRKVCDAVAYAHSRRIVHRDLKPENIMIGAFGEVLLMDWGIALDLDARDAAARAAGAEGAPARPSGAIGTPAYMAPELAEGIDARVGPATDVYLLGAILYELLTGTPPHRGASLLETLVLAREGKVEPPERRAPDRRIDATLAAIAMRALEPDPARRYAGALEMAQALEERERHEAAVALAEAGEREAEAARAASREGSARPAEVYGRFGAAVATLAEAHARWPEDAATARRLSLARADFALYAVSLGDLALAEAEAAKVPAGDPAGERARAAVAAARAARSASRRRRALAGAALVLLLLVAAAFGVEEWRHARRLEAARERRKEAELAIASGVWAEYEAKLAAARRAIAIDPTWSGAWAELGRVYIREDMEATLSRGADEARTISAYRNADLCYACALALGADDPSTLNDAAFCRANAGDWPGARALYARCAEKGSDGAPNPYALDAAGIIALDDARFADAERAFARCLLALPERYYRYELGIARAALGRLDEARTGAEEALGRDYWNEPAGFLAALVHLALGDDRSAAQVLAFTLPENDDSPHLLALLGVHAARLGDERAARAAFERAKVARGRFGPVCGDRPWYSCLARAEGEVGRLGRATMLELGPEAFLAPAPAPSVLARRDAEAALARGAPSEAFNLASLALADDPADGAAYLARGRALLALGRPRAAVEDLRRAPPLLPERYDEARAALAEAEAAAARPPGR